MEATASFGSCIAMSTPTSCLVIGATGFVGGHVARHLSNSGLAVSGLYRKPDAKLELERSGIAPVLGDLVEDFDAVASAVRTVDAVIYAAQVPFDAEPMIVRRLLDVLSGTGKTFVFLSGTGVLMQRTQGAWSSDVFAEDDDFTPEPFALARVEVEKMVRSAEGVRGIVVRPPVIWGPDDNGPVAQIYRSVAATGSACFIGSGLGAYSNVHVADVAELFRIVLERGRAGATYHAVAGEIAWRWIAEAVARDLDVPTRSLTLAEAEEVWGPFGALLLSASSRSRDPRTRAELGWAPTHHDLLSEVGEPRLRQLARP